jgi:hypothetical protein
MKNFWILFGLSLLWALPIKAQDTLTIYQAYTSFSDPEKAEWTAFQNDWNYFDYAALKKKHHIKQLNCRHCESFYAEVYIEIDEKGNVSKSASLRASRCGLSTTEKILCSDFESSIRKHHFTTLKNKRFVARFGLVLKC